MTFDKMFMRTQFTTLIHAMGAHEVSVRSRGQYRLPDPPLEFDIEFKCVYEDTLMQWVFHINKEDTEPLLFNRFNIFLLYVGDDIKKRIED